MLPKAKSLGLPAAKGTDEEQDQAACSAASQSGWRFRKESSTARHSHSSDAVRREGSEVGHVETVESLPVGKSGTVYLRRFLPIRLHGERVLTEEAVNQYRVESSSLEATMPGLSFFKSAQEGDPDEDLEPLGWGDVVSGTDLGNGWAMCVVAVRPADGSEQPQQVVVHVNSIMPSNSFSQSMSRRSSQGCALSGTFLMVVPATFIFGSICTGCAVAGATWAACSIAEAYMAQLHAAAAGCVGWPGSYAELALGQRPRHVILEGLLYCVGPGTLHLATAFPRIMARRSQGALPDRAVVLLCCGVAALVLWTNSMWALAAVYGPAHSATLLYILSGVPEIICIPIFVCWMLWQVDDLRSKLTFAMYIFVLTVGTLGAILYTFSWDAAALTVCVMLALLPPAVLLIQRLQGAPGLEKDMGSQLLLGYLNFKLPQVLPSLFMSFVQGLGTSELIASWIAVSFVFKKVVLVLVGQSVPEVWRGQAAFPYLFLEDFVPVLIFADAQPLTADFWVSTLGISLWELLRDAPPLRLYLIEKLRDAWRGWCADTCVARGLAKARAWIAGVGAVLLALVGGSVASEAVGDVVEDLGDNLDAASMDRDMIARIDLARMNMVGELIAGVSVLASVVVTRLSGQPPRHSVENVLVLLAAEAATIAVCGLVNARYILRRSLILPRIGVSRVAVASASFAMVGTVVTAVYESFLTEVSSILDQGCPVPPGNQTSAT